MSSLSSASSLGEIRAAYANNASYIEDESAAKARAFITACTMLLMRLPKRASKGGSNGEEIELDPRLVAEQIADAKRFLTQANLSSAPTRCFSIENFRD